MILVQGNIRLRVTPDGTWLAFESERELTKYDNAVPADVGERVNWLNRVVP